MSKSMTEIKTNARNEIIAELKNYFEQGGNEVLTISNTEFCYPIVLEGGIEAFASVKVSIPTGSKDEPFDGYVKAENFRIDTERKNTERAEKKAEAERKKKEKESKRIEC